MLSRCAGVIGLLAPFGAGKSTERPFNVGALTTMCEMALSWNSPTNHVRAVAWSAMPSHS